MGEASTYFIGYPLGKPLSEHFDGFGIPVNIDGSPDSFGEEPIYPEGGDPTWEGHTGVADPPQAPTLAELALRKTATDQGEQS